MIHNLELKTHNSKLRQRRPVPPGRMGTGRAGGGPAGAARLFFGGRRLGRLFLLLLLFLLVYLLLLLGVFRALVSHRDPPLKLTLLEFG